MPQIMNIQSGESSAPDQPLTHNNRTKYSFWRKSNKKMWLAWALLIMGLMLTGVAAFYAKRGVESIARKEFDFACNEIQNRISTRLKQHAQILRSGSAFFEINEFITHEHWHNSIARQNIEQTLPGIQGIGYAIIIPPDQLALHEQKVRNEGFPQYAVKPKGKRDIYTSIIYLEPFSGRNLRAFGYDMFSEPIRRKAMEHARDFNEASLSGKITLVQETDKDIQAGTLMYVPVYGSGLPIKTVEERRRAIRGWVYSPYRMNDLMRGILGGWELSEGRQIRLEVFDNGSYQPEALLYDSRAGQKIGATSAIFSKRTSIICGNHQWNLRFTQISNSMSGLDYSKSWHVVIGGALVSFLLFALSLLLINTSDRAQTMAAALTRELRESEEKYRILFNNEIYAICIFDLENLKFLDVNEAFCHKYGYSKNELLSGMTIHDVTVEHESSDSATQQAVLQGAIFIPLRYHKKKDGSVFPVEIVGGPYSWKGRKVMFALAHDITERKQMEEELLKSKEQYDNLVSNIPVGVYTIHSTKDGAFAFEYVSPRVAEMFNVSAESFLEDPQAGFRPIHPDDLDALVKLNQERFQQPQPFNWEGRAIVDGVVKWFRIFSSPDLLGDGDVLWHGVIADITDRKQAEAVLIQTRKNYEAFFNTIDEFLFVLDEQGNIIHTNTTVIERLGYTREELAGQSVLMVHPPERRNEAGRIVGEMLSGAAEFCPVPIITKSGIQIPVETIVSRGFWDGSPVIFGVTKDISKVRLSEEKFSKLFHINPSACGLSDLNDHKYIEVNEAFYTLLGFDKEEVIGKTACDLGILTAEARNAILLKADTEGNITNAEADLKAKNGDIKHVLLSSESIHVQENKYRFTVVYDITDRKRAEAEKEKMEAKNRQLQKSESLGRMAGAISHTFNNQLGVVIGNLELAMMELPRGAMSHAKIIEAMKACNKAAEISGLMLIYLGQSFDDHKPIDLSDVCRKTLPMLKTVMLAKVVIKADLPSPGPIIMANENHIQQVLINLTTNAWEAIGENQGMIHLKVKTVSPEGIPVANRFPVGWQPQDSPYACLEVTDTAAGIADKDIEKIFDPFFSTKFTGRGMGLAVVQGIVRTHNGVATVASEPGNGSTFRIFIPVSAAEGRQPDKVADDSEVLIGSVSPAKLEGVGSVLLVEDEEMVRNVAAALIKRLGFIVFEAKDGVEAVEVFREHQNEIKCVLCDLTMPRMNGWETLTALRKLAPGIPVILASGYDKAQVMSGDHPELPQVFLGKPYNLKDLSNAIKDALADKT